MSDTVYAEPIEVTEAPPGGWYHTVDVPGFGVIDGQWDLRHCTPEYLGNYDFAGKRILEVGPASGYLTFWMEDAGAEVVAVDVAFDKPWDIVPRRGGIAASEEQLVRGATNLRRAWWWQHGVRGSQARAAYTGAYDLPDELGRFDAALLAGVLLHLRYPFDAIEAAAAHTDTLIISDRTISRLERPGLPFAELQPGPDNDKWGTWWSLSSTAVTRMVGLLGFEVVNRTDAVAMVASGGRRDAPAERAEVPTYTIVAERRTDS